MKRKVFSQSKWIWQHSNQSQDEYCDFYSEFFTETKEVFCNISVDTDYALYINGCFVASNQYGDFEHYKIYDTLDLSAYVREGSNSFALTVWHCGVSNQRYVVAKPGLIFEVCTENEIILTSDENTLVRKNLCYVSGKQQWITPQLGFTFCYDANGEDHWEMGNAQGFCSAVTVNKICEFYPRPIKKAQVLPIVKAKIIKQSETCYLLDLGQETVGIAALSFFSRVKQKITVAYGENTKEGKIRRKIGNRDFSFSYIAKVGKNESVHPFLRLGCRYLELSSEYPIDINQVGIYPQIYSTHEIVRYFDSPLDANIYAMCVNTLKLCMMEHYVDCPWREQNLYAYDARNQMLSGYYAFTDGNFAYARANLILMSHDRRNDGLLSICFPCGTDLTIPAFSLYYFLAVEEYMHHSADYTIFNDVNDKLLSILHTFLENSKNGLICKFSGKNHWNFYDWSRSLAGRLYEEDVMEPDLIIGCLAILALKAYKNMCVMANAVFSFDNVLDGLSKNLKSNFFRADCGLFSVSLSEEIYTELGNSLAVLAGLTSYNEAQHICELLQARKLEKCSLGMMSFRYDAMLCVDSKYKNCVLQEIREIYGKMLAAGSTTTWETEEGTDAFDGAGSLCHGWSAIPIYYFGSNLI